MDHSASSFQLHAHLLSLVVSRCSRICLIWGQAPMWGQFNQAKPGDVHNMTGWISYWSPPWQGYFFPIWQPGHLGNFGGFCSLLKNFLSQDSCNPIFVSTVVPLRNADLQPGCSSPGHCATGRLMRMLKVLDINCIWIFTSIMCMEHLCIFSMVNDKAIWRFAPQTLPDFQKVENACSKNCFPEFLWQQNTFIVLHYLEINAISFLVALPLTSTAVISVSVSSVFVHIPR